MLYNMSLKSVNEVKLISIICYNKSLIKPEEDVTELFSPHLNIRLRDILIITSIHSLQLIS